MKKWMCILVMLLLCSGAYSTENKTISPQPIIQATQTDNKPYYLTFYKVDAENFYMDFIPLSKDAIKTLDPELKKDYKKFVKIENCIKKNKYKKAFNIDSDYLPTKVAYMHYLADKKECKNLYKMLALIVEQNKTSKLFNQKKMELTTGYVAWLADEYQMALQFLTPYIKTTQEFEKFNLNYIFMDSHYKLNNYSSTIFYAKKIENMQQYKLIANKHLMWSFDKLGNKQEAYKYAKKIVQMEPNRVNYIGVVFTTSNSTEKLQYLYKIVDTYITEQNYSEAAKICYNDISPLEETKIKNAAKTITGFVKLPNWREIMEQDVNYMSFKSFIERQNNFYKSTNDCITKYKGNDLKACFNNINEQQEKISHRLVEEKRAQEQAIAEQQRILQLQQMNYNLQRQNYILNQTRYTNSTTTRYGNTYYTNSYSY